MLKRTMLQKTHERKRRRISHFNSATILNNTPVYNTFVNR